MSSEEEIRGERRPTETAHNRTYDLGEIHRRGPVEAILSNGMLTSRISTAGAGVVSVGNIVVNRWNEDATQEIDGCAIYLRDRDTGHFWSATLQPVQRKPDAYDVRLEPDSIFFERLQDGIRTTLEVFVAPDRAAELRRLTICNVRDVRCRLDVTSYIEIALNDAAADRAHPAFSRLFVQTRFLPQRNGILAWRRRRSPDEDGTFMIHSAAGAGRTAGFETSRSHFIGRGRSTRNPMALDPGRALEGHQGGVLDPVAALRRDLELEPGEGATVRFLLGAGANEAAVVEMLHDFADSAEENDTDGSFEEAAGHPQGPPRATHEFLSESGNGRRRSMESDDGAGEPKDPTGVPDGADGGSGPWLASAPLQFDNGFGGFSPDGREYRIRVAIEDGHPVLPPQPWTNVIANERLGFIVSETGAGCTWSRNSREHRITPWSNDPVTDPHGEAFYIRDEDTGAFWSPTPGPARAADPYEVRHGFGYTEFGHRSHSIQQTLTQFVAVDEPVKLTLVRLENLSSRPRQLSVFSYAHLVLGSRPEETRDQIDVAWDRDRRAILAHNDSSGEYSEALVFAAARADGAEVTSCTDRLLFLGRLGDPSHPRAMGAENVFEGAPETARSGGTRTDPCAALRVRLTLPANGAITCAFILGDANDEAELTALLDRYGDAAGLQTALAKVQAFWGGMTRRLQIRTPSPEIDLMVNGWLTYQNLSCRMYGRSAFYQSGGAFGYRDQLQDSGALVYVDPSMTRRQILLHAANQFVEGDVMHWWHPPTGKGIRTRFSDDLLWLPYLISFYVRTTGDHTVLDESVPFLTGRLLLQGEDEVFLRPTASGEVGDLYDHCCRAIDRSLATGRHGLPLMGTGDWNDGMNRVGREGRGESVWLGFFLVHVLSRFIPLCKTRNDSLRVAQYEKSVENLRVALNDAGWDGAWYRRAFYDNGDVLGSRESDEARVDALAQAWSVLSGVAPADRAEMALDAVERELVDEDAGIIRLLAPPFDRTTNDPGYIKGYVPGVRENGGQYTHGVLWAIRALAEVGRGDRAASLLAMLSPVHHTRTREAAERYRVEPYVVAADIYGAPPHVGRGGWTWYTGSAAWMYRVAVESLLGFRIEDGSIIVLDPSIDPSWPSFALTYELPDHPTRYEIQVKNPHGHMRGVRSARLDGRDLPISSAVATVPIVRDGKAHRVDVTM